MKASHVPGEDAPPVGMVHEAIDPMLAAVKRSARMSFGSHCDAAPPALSGWKR